MDVVAPIDGVVHSMKATSRWRPSLKRPVRTQANSLPHIAPPILRSLRTSSGAPVAPSRLPLRLAHLRRRLALARSRPRLPARRRRREQDRARERRHTALPLLLGQPVVAGDPAFDRRLAGEVDAVGE